MRLKTIWISDYKNLKDFYLDLGGGTFLDIFVGKNGSGKSNLLEAIVEIYSFLYDYKENEVIPFDFVLLMELDSKDVKIEYTSGKIKINDSEVKKVDLKFLPEKVILYYSGHNGTVATIVKKYETTFRGKIKRAKLDDSRTMISIGSDYKEILLGVLLLQSNTCKAKSYIVEKLRIKEIGPWFKLILKRPFFTKIEIEIDEGESRFWGAEGVVRNFIDRLLMCQFEDKSGRAKTEGFTHSDQRYHLYFDMEKVLEEFPEYSALDFFNQFDNLKSLEMLEELSIPIILDGKKDANISYFSDGQFQSIYMYAITEIFKNKNCLTLLDEPDAFLHPEWQFLFINQLNDISDKTAKSNHLIMSSHSASTVANADENMIKLFKFDGTFVKTIQASKSDVVKSLSAGIIKYSEAENLLRIDNAIRLSDKSVLFVEGPSDVSILETAYQKLYPNEEIPFLIQDVFGYGMIKVLLGKNDLFSSYPNKAFIGLYDFDKAYSDWRDFSWTYYIDNLSSGLGKKHGNKKAYAFLLPVPENEIKVQVWDDNHPIEKLLPNPHFCIEHLFWHVKEAKSYFKEESGRIIFKGDKHKISFAKNIVPTFSSPSFEVLRPFFEIIKAIK